MRNARFWTWCGDGWVKVTLRPGQSLLWGRFERTDEGYNVESCRWEYDDGLGLVMEEYTSGGRDCDGRLTVHTDYVCPVDELAAVPAESDEYGDRPARPAWVRTADWQRDEYAEAAGY